VLSQREIVIREASVSSGRTSCAGAPPLELRRSTSSAQRFPRAPFRRQSQAGPELASALDVRGELSGAISAIGARGAGGVRRARYADLAVWRRLGRLSAGHSRREGRSASVLNLDGKTHSEATADVLSPGFDASRKDDSRCSSSSTLRGRLGGESRGSEGLRSLRRKLS